MSRTFPWQALAVLVTLCAEHTGSVDADSSAKRGQTHAVTLHRQRVPVRSEEGVLSFKSVYFGSIRLGAPEPQSFTVVFDTGSGHVILPSVLCDSPTCMAHRRYDLALSNVSQQVDYDGSPVQPGAPRDQVTVAFGTGEVTGQFSHDRLCLDVAAGSEDATAGSGCIDMRIVMASEMSEEPFATFIFDGVLGLGLESLALSPEFSFFGMLSRHGNLDTPRFGVYLADSEEDVSELFFGGHNPERVRSEPFWVPVAMPELGYWQVRILAVRIGGKTLDFCADGSCRAVVDTGTSLIAVPEGIAGEMQDELERALVEPPREGGKLDCRKATGNAIVFVLETGETIELMPGEYARPSLRTSLADDDEAAVSYATEALESQAPHPSDTANATDAAAEVPRCHPTLMAIDMPEPIGPKLFIFGDPVLRKYYTTYDWETKSVGFALAKHRSSIADELLADELANEVDTSTTLGPLLML